MVGLYRDEGLPVYERVHYSRGEHIAEVEDILRWYPSRSTRLLDVGCSGGLHALEFSRRGFRVTGLDIERSAIEQANSRAHSEGLSANFHCLDVGVEDLGALGSFDLVYSIGNVLSHLPPEQLRAALPRLGWSLRRSGTFLFDVLMIDAPFQEEIAEEASGIVWARKLDRESGRIRLMGTFPGGIREHFDVWGYRVDEVRTMLCRAGFENPDVSRDLGFRDAQPLGVSPPQCLYFRTRLQEAP
jgi:SAM-dependent methyltransferase